jgi:hypothetical protein
LADAAPGAASKGAGMKILIALAFVLATALPAQSAASSVLRVDRPEKGAGAQVTTARLLHGTVSHRTQATVLSDSRCNPDAHGVSHCLNRLRLVDGRTVTVVHDHRMATMPCLSPGEHVTLTPR